MKKYDYQGAYDRIMLGGFCLIGFGGLTFVWGLFLGEGETGLLFLEEGLIVEAIVEHLSNIGVMLGVGFVIIIIYTLWRFFTEDYINNEKEKEALLYEEFNPLIGLSINCKYYGNSSYTKYGEEIILKVESVLLTKPRKLKKHKWVVEIRLEDHTSPDPDHTHSRYFKILNISDLELEKLINNKAGVKSIINSVKEDLDGVDLDMLNPDVFISALSESSSHK